MAAGRRQLRPILLTTLTTVLGLLPLMLEQSFQAKFLIPMAISISFGLISERSSILVVLPALLVLFDTSVQGPQPTKIPECFNFPPFLWPGLAVGEAMVVDDLQEGVERQPIEAQQVDAECLRVQDTLDQVAGELGHDQDRVKVDLVPKPPRSSHFILACSEILRQGHTQSHPRQPRRCGPCDR